MERFRASHARDHQPFGIKTINICMNNLRDEGVFEALGYAVNDASLETLYVDDNGIEVGAGSLRQTPSGADISPAGRR